LTFASRSIAGTTTRYSRLRPAEDVSVTCIDIALHGPYCAHLGRFLGKKHPPCWCGRRGSNPHDFRHGNLNPARLPIPPRPRQEGGPASRLISCALGRTTRKIAAAAKWATDPLRRKIGSSWNHVSSAW